MAKPAAHEARRADALATRAARVVPLAACSDQLVAHAVMRAECSAPLEDRLAQQEVQMGWQVGPAAMQEAREARQEAPLATLEAFPVAAVAAVAAQARLAAE